MPSDGEHGHTGLIQLTNELHIAEDRSISRVVEHGAVCNGQYKSCSDSNVVCSLFILCCRRVLGFDHGGRHVVQLHSSTKVHPDGVGHSLAANVGCELIDRHHG